MASRAQAVAAHAGLRLQEADLEDLLADIALAMWAHEARRLRMYRPDGGASVTSWLALIASSVVRDVLRKRRRRPAELQPLEVLEAAMAPERAPDADLLERERRAFAGQALAELSDRDQRFARLYFLDALEPSAVAEQMGVSVATVYSKKTKLAQRLRAVAAARFDRDPRAHASFGLAPRARALV